MSTTSATFGHHSATADTAPRKSFFERIIEARMRQGQARVGATFERMSDAQLADLGFNPDQVRHVRKTGLVPDSYWRA